FDGKAGAEIVKLHGAGGLGQDREGEGIPFGEDLAVADGFALGNTEARAVHDVVTLLFAVLFIHDDNQAGAVHGDESAAAALNVAQLDEANDAGVLGFESGALADAGGRATDVEGAHGELRAGLSDGLSGDDADSFAEFDHAAGGQVTPVAEGTDTAPGFAGQHGTDAHALDAGRLNGVGEFLGDFLIDIDDDAALEVLDLFEGDAAHDAVAQRLDFDARFDDGLDVDTVAGAAVALVDDDVLRNVDQPAGQIARIGGLERRIGKALTRAVGGDEVLQHREAFAEVGSDGGFDDFAGGLGHETAHAGKL